MARLRNLIHRILGRTRVVESGSYPLYRLIALSATISAIMQMVTQTWPQSFVDAAATTWSGWVFSTAQLFGGLFVWIALYMHEDSEPSLSRVQLSLSLERMGCALMISVIGTYTYGVVDQNGGIPKAWATWALMFFGLYLVYRFNEIRKALKELRSE